MKKFAFYVSNNATRLKKILYKYGTNKLVKSIGFVLIDNVENLELKALCKNLNINYYETDLKNEKNKNQFISNLFLTYLDIHNIDFSFIFADRILIGELLEKYKNKLINFHPAILPSHKGLNAIDQALKENTFLLGNSAHIVTKDLDAGNVVMQNIFPAINFKNYDDILDNQLIMTLQLMDWISTDRLKVIHEKVVIKNASYKVDEFIPNIELHDI